MSLLSDIRLREYGHKEKYTFTVSSTIERFACSRHDEHHIEAQEFGECTPPLACRFSHGDPHTLAVADEDGGILILDTKQKGITAVQQDWLAHKNAVFDVDWMPMDNKLLTASGDKTTALWDVELEERLGIYKGHTGSVKTARFSYDNKNIFASGARDGHILLYDRRVKEKDGFIPAINVIRNAHKSVNIGSSHKKRKPHQQDGPQSVTAVVFQDEHTIVSSGSVDGSINVWDLRKNYSNLKTDAIPKHSFLYAGTSTRIHGFSCLTLDSSKSLLFASCMDNIIYQYDATAYSKAPVACYQGHKNATFYVKCVLSPDENFLLSGSSDNTAYVWKVSEPSSQPWMLQGHSSEVSAVDWCKSEIGKLVTVSDDSTIRLWRLNVEPDMATEPGDRVGSVQRMQDKSTSMTLAGPNGLVSMVNKKVSKTPKKGNTVPSSPAKMSPAMKKTILSLSASKENKKQSNFKPQCNKNMSPSIRNWFGKSPSQKIEASPLKKTPKKLFITPKKVKQTPSTSASFSFSSQPQAPSSVKRKLYDQVSPSGQSENKKRKVDEGFFCGHIHDENSCDGFSAPDYKSPSVSGKVLTEKNPLNESPGSSNLDLCSELDLKTPQKNPETQEYQSPTVNLPNYVVDPVPRTPQARVSPKCHTPRTPNWLTQMKLQRTMSASKAVRNEALETTPKSSVLAAERSCRTTPRRKKVTMKRRGSITQYFSPSSH